MSKIQDLSIEKIPVKIIFQNFIFFSKNYQKWVKFFFKKISTGTSFIYGYCDKLSIFSKLHRFYTIFIMSLFFTYNCGCLCVCPCVCKVTPKEGEAVRSTA